MLLIGGQQGTTEGIYSALGLQLGEDVSIGGIQIASSIIQGGFDDTAVWYSDPIDPSKPNLIEIDLTKVGQNIYVPPSPTPTPTPGEPTPTPTPVDPSPTPTPTPGEPSPTPSPTPADPTPTPTPGEPTPTPEPGTSLIPPGQNTTGLTQVSTITVDGQPYYLSDTLNPSLLKEGEFFYDPYTGKAIARERTTDVSTGLPRERTTNSYPLVNVVGKTSSDCINTDFIKGLPDWFSWLPLRWTFSYTLGLESEPSGTCTFETWFTNKNAVIQRLSKGASFSAFGIGFRVASVSWEELKRADITRSTLRVSLSLTGTHYWLDNEVPLIKRLDDDRSNTGVDPDCATGEATQTEDGIARTRSLSWLCSEAGGRLSGMSGEILVDSDITPEEGKIPRAEIQARLRQEGKFLDLTDPNAVYCRNWNSVPTHRLTEDFVLSDVNATINGGDYQDMRNPSGLFHHDLDEGLPANWVIGTPLSARDEQTSHIKGSYFIWPKQEVTGQFLEEDEEEEIVEETEGQTPATLPDYRSRTRVVEERWEDPDFAETPPEAAATNDLSLAFWRSGSNYNKIKRFVQTIDGVEVFVQEWIYGFAGPLAVDCYQNTGGGVYVLKKVALQNFWKLIGQTTTTHFYQNRQEIYTGYQKTGWQLTVFKSEPAIDVSDLDSSPLDQYPTLKLDQRLTEFEGDPINESAVNLAISAYRPHEVPSYEELLILNEPEMRYYKDVARQGVTEIKRCLPDGTSVRLASIDKTFQQPYIVTASVKFSSSLDWMEDPRNGVLKEANSAGASLPLFPPLVTGQEAQELRVSRILKSKNTLGVWEGGSGLQPSVGVDQSGQSLDEDKYVVFSQTSTAGGQGGAGFQSQISGTQREDFDGKPDASKRLPPLWELIPDENPVQTEKIQNAKSPETFRYFAWTPDAPNYDSSAKTVVSSSLSFPYAEKVSEAKRAIQTTLDIENCKGSYTDGFKTFFNPDFRPGDKLNYFCNAERRKRRILSINATINFQGSVNGSAFCTSSMEMDLGFPLEMSFQWSKEDVPIPSEESGFSSAPLDVWLDPLYNDSIGNVGKGQQTRLFPPGF